MNGFKKSQEDVAQTVKGASQTVEGADKKAEVTSTIESAKQNVAKSAREARNVLVNELNRLVPFIKPTNVLASLPEEALKGMSEFVEKKKVKVEQPQLTELARAMLATEFRDIEPETETQGKAFRDELHEYLTIVGTTTSTELPDAQKKTEAKLIEVYKGLAAYRVNVEAVKDDSKGQIESLWDEVKEAGFGGVGKLLDMYADAEPYEKLLIGGAAVALGLWTALSASPSAGNMRKVLFAGVIGTAGLTIANWGVEKATDKSIVQLLDGANATADVDGLGVYLELEGEDKDDVAETLVDGMLFNPNTKHLKAKDVFAKTKGLSGVKKEDQTLSYDSENLDGALFYRGVDAFTKRLNKLKTKEPNVYAEINEAINNDAELYEVYIMLFSLDPDAWYVKSYHTETGRLVEEKLFDSDFENYLEDDLDGFTAWFKSTSMYTAEHKNTPGLLTKEYFRIFLGQSYENMLKLSSKSTSYSSTLNECLNSKEPKRDVQGRQYMAVNFPIAAGETPDSYIKNAYTELAKKYTIKGETEPIIGALIEKPSAHYVLMVRTADKESNSIV